jgi:hypothetical protein
MGKHEKPLSRNTGKGGAGGAHEKPGTDKKDK